LSGGVVHWVALVGGLLFLGFGIVVLAALNSSGLGRLNAVGRSRARKIAVGTEAKAVNTLTPPKNQYEGTQRVHTSNRCVAPHAAMKTLKQTNIQLKGTSRLLRTK
jgi:hypothetical protein